MKRYRVRIDIDSFAVGIKRPYESVMERVVMIVSTDDADRAMTIAFDAARQRYPMTGILAYPAEEIGEME